MAGATEAVEVALEEEVVVDFFLQVLEPVEELELDDVDPDSETNLATLGPGKVYDAVGSKAFL